MPAKAALEPVFIDSRNRWRVDVPASKTHDGKRVRAHFKTRQAARDYIDRIDGPVAAAALDPRLAADADTARQRIEAAGLDLTLAEVVSRYLEAHKVLNGSGTLLQAAESFHRQSCARSLSKLMGEAVVAFMTLKEGVLRDATIKSYRYTLERVFLPLHERMLADITLEDLEAVLGPKKPTARAMHIRNLRTFWKWCSRQPRQWAEMQVVDSIEHRRDSLDGDIQILRPDDVRALMKAAEAEGSGAAVAYAIAVFGGVRMAELSRLTWSAVSEDHIEIGRAIAKKHSRRLVPVDATLRAWLSKYRGDAKRSENIVPANWTDVSKSVRRRAGWAVRARLLSDPPEPTRGPWPANACRHTCASVQIAIGASLEDLTFKFGHAGGHDTLRAHYVARLSKKDALAILAVGPGGRKISVISAA